MTVSSTTSKVSYSGNGSTVAFTVTFYFLADAHVKVLVRSANGTETVKTLGSDYTVTGAGDPAGGTVTFGTAPIAGETVVLARNVPLTQVTDYTPNDPFPAETHEEALDKLTQIVQQINETVDRSIKLSLSNTMTSTEFTVNAAARANKVLGFDAAGELAVTQEIGTYRGNWSSGTAYQQRDIIKDTSNANIYICVTSHTSSGSQPISSNTDSAKWALLVDAEYTSDKADEAAASAAASASSASDSAASASLANDWATKTSSPVAGGEYSAKYHALAAATSASNASTSATAAQSAQSAAETARDQTLAAYDQFDDRYLGTKTSDPTLDNDGNALVAGALYFNSVDGIMKLYTGSAWVAAYVSGSASGISFTPTGNVAATNVQAAIAEVDSEKIATTAIGSTVQAYDADTAKTDVSQTFTAGQRGEITTLTDGATITPDFADSNNFTVTLGGNRTLANPSNLVAGQSGSIFVVQDGTGSRTLAYGSYYDFAGGTAPTLSTAASAVDRIDYVVRSSTSIHCVFTANYS